MQNIKGPALVLTLVCRALKTAKSGRCRSIPQTSVLGALTVHFGREEKKDIGRALPNEYVFGSLMGIPAAPPSLSQGRACQPTN